MFHFKGLESELMETRMQTFIFAGFFIALGAYFALRIPVDIKQGIASGKYEEKRTKLIVWMRIMGAILLVCGIGLFLIGVFVER